MLLTQVLGWLGLTLGAVGALALVAAGSLPLLDDVLAQHIARRRRRA